MDGALNKVFIIILSLSDNNFSVGSEKLTNSDDTYTVMIITVMIIYSDDNIPCKVFFAQFVKFMVIKLWLG